MNRFPFFLPLFALFFAACDQTAIKKEAYDKGFADGQAEARAEIARQNPARATPPRLLGTALDRPKANTQRSQTRSMGPTSNFQGTALDQKPKR